MFRRNNTRFVQAKEIQSEKILLDQNGVNCLKASNDKGKQPNWNKTNEMNISLVSTTIFPGKKNNTGSVSVNTVIRIKSKITRQCAIKSIIDKA